MNSVTSSVFGALLFLTVGLTANSAQAAGPTFFLETGEDGQRFGFEPDGDDDAGLPLLFRSPRPEIIAVTGGVTLLLAIPMFVAAGNLLNQNTEGMGSLFTGLGWLGATILGHSMLITGGAALGLGIILLIARDQLRKNGAFAQREAPAPRDSRRAQTRVTWGLRFGACWTRRAG
jgi:hypothetical protein